MDEFTQCQRLFQEIGQKLNWFKQRPQDVLVNLATRIREEDCAKTEQLSVAERTEQFSVAEGGVRSAVDVAALSSQTQDSSVSQVSNQMDNTTLFDSPSPLSQFESMNQTVTSLGTSSRFTDQTCDDHQSLKTFPAGVGYSSRAGSGTTPSSPVLSNATTAAVVATRDISSGVNVYSKFNSSISPQVLFPSQDSSSIDPEPDASVTSILFTSSSIQPTTGTPHQDSLPSEPQLHSTSSAAIADVASQATARWSRIQAMGDSDADIDQCSSVLCQMSISGTPYDQSPMPRSTCASVASSPDTSPLRQNHQPSRPTMSLFVSDSDGDNHQRSIANGERRKQLIYSDSDSSESCEPSINTSSRPLMDYQNQSSVNDLPGEDLSSSDTCGSLPAPRQGSPPTEAAGAVIASANTSPFSASMDIAHIEEQSAMMAVSTSSPCLDSGSGLNNEGFSDLDNDEDSFSPDQKAVSDPENDEVSFSSDQQLCSDPENDENSSPGQNALSDPDSDEDSFSPDQVLCDPESDVDTFSPDSDSDEDSFSPDQKSHSSPIWYSPRIDFQNVDNSLSFVLPSSSRSTHHQSRLSFCASPCQTAESDNASVLSPAPSSNRNSHHSTKQSSVDRSPFPILHLDDSDSDVAYHDEDSDVITSTSDDRHAAAEDSSFDDCRSVGVSEQHGEVPPTRPLPTTYVQDSSSDDDFEQFLIEAKTPKKCGKQSVSSLNNSGGFIVDDDEVDLLSSEEENDSFVADLPASANLSRPQWQNFTTWKTPVQSNSTSSYVENDVPDHWDLPLSTPTKTRLPSNGLVTPLKTPNRLPTTTPMSVRTTNFKKSRSSLVDQYFQLFNSSVFSNKLPADLNITWNNRMRTTSGFCFTKRTSSGEFTARIELADKVCDSEDSTAGECKRLRDTLLHEMCHAAVWIIDKIKGGHGPAFKSWAKRAGRAHPNIPCVSRCHNYSIATKFSYKCSGCGYVIGRHSKSVKTDRQVCPYCYCAFELQSDTSKAASGFALFVKENFKRVKASMPIGCRHGDVMSQLSCEYRDLKEAVSANSTVGNN